MPLHPTEESRRKRYALAEVLFIFVLAIVPLFSTFPYRINIFLSWEGAYRISQGQVPYRDFGMPLGYMYWIIPAFFFKLFGPQMITLVKAQVFINIISGLAFRSILRTLKVNEGIVLISVLLYALSFSFFNFWPWYNHTVFVYEFIGLAFLLKYIFSDGRKYTWVWLVLSALFTFVSFFTKQDGGGLAILLCLAILLYHCIYERKWASLAIYLGSVVLIGFIFIYPLTKFNFGYWFNHGQPPHTSRISIAEISDEFFASSQWIKFYLFIIVLLVFAKFQKTKLLFQDKTSFVFLLLCVGILAESAIIQVTSYTPLDNNIFFHSFAFALILSLLASLLQINFIRLEPVLLCLAGIMLWWSGAYWKYVQRISDRVFPQKLVVTNTGENIVNKSTYTLKADTTEIPMSEWVYTGLKSFDKIYMPKPTVEGIHRLLNMDIVRNNKNLHVLNMSELTPLAVEIPYQLDKGPEVPLWYHLGVAMFNKDAERFESSIAKRDYDLVLFEYIPTLNNFYPFRIRDSLQNHYQMVDSFMAPRRGDTKGTIEVYLRK